MSEVEPINNKLVRINNKLWDELKGQVCDLDILLRLDCKVECDHGLVWSSFCAVW